MNRVFIINHIKLYLFFNRQFNSFSKTYVNNTTLSLYIYIEYFVKEQPNYSNEGALTVYLTLFV